MTDLDKLGAEAETANRERLAKVVLELIAELRAERAKALCYPNYYLPPPTHGWWFT